MDQSPARRADPSAAFAVRLNSLFASRRNPVTGQRYTLREVSEATGRILGVSYISALRRGQIAMPPADRVQLLADVFQVDIGYFFGREEIVDVRSAEEMSAEEVDLRRVLADPTISDIARRAGRLGPAERELVLQTLAWAERQVRGHQASHVDDEHKQ